MAAVSASVAITITIVSIALAAAAAAAQMMQQQAAMQAQAKHQAALQRQREAEIAKNYALSIEAYKNETKALQARQSQMDEAATQQLQEQGLAGARARATARVAAGEAGVSGISVEALLSDFMGQEARYRESVNSNLENQRAQTNMEIEGARATAEGRAQSIPAYLPQPVQQPDYAGAALRVGAAGLQGYQKLSGPNVQWPDTTPAVQTYRPGYD